MPKLFNVVLFCREARHLKLKCLQNLVKNTRKPTLFTDHFLKHGCTNQEKDLLQGAHHWYGHSAQAGCPCCDHAGQGGFKALSGAFDGLTFWKVI